MARTLFATLRTFFRTDESGQDLVEYALIAAVVGLGSVAALQNVAAGVGTIFSSVGATLTTSL